jgi:hypothetical protein
VTRAGKRTTGLKLTTNSFRGSGGIEDPKLTWMNRRKVKKASSKMNERRIEPCYGHVFRQPTQLAGMLIVRLSDLHDSYRVLRERNVRVSRHSYLRRYG